MGQVKQLVQRESASLNAMLEPGSVEPSERSVATTVSEKEMASRPKESVSHDSRQREARLLEPGDPAVEHGDWRALILEPTVHAPTFVQTERTSVAIVG